VTEPEQVRLDRVADWYTARGFEGRMVRASAAAVLAHSAGRSALEVGAAEGNVTAQLATRFERIVVVEPADVYADAVLARGLPGVDVVRTLVEDFRTDERFDTVVLSHVLEHVDSPGDVLRSCASLLAPGGRLVVVVPNAGSLHRRLGVRMGMLDDVHELTPADLAIGHRRVYDPQTLQADLRAAGLAVEHFEGHFCKPLANSQIDALSEAAQDALLQLGGELPAEFASEIMAVCRR
jgi:2-polyprenyl-3-methyl-5-hydroxy-6-metoxy-1,4-benzoquinol methylase